MIRQELGFSRDEFRNLSWVDQRMYVEELTIYLYKRDHAHWESMDEDQQWEHEEPEKPQVLLDQELEEWEEERQVVLPDILDG